MCKSNAKNLYSNYRGVVIMPILCRKTTDSEVSRSIEAGVSQSEIGVYDNCNYRWYLEYVLGYKDIAPEFILSVGTAFHSALETLHTSLGEKVIVPPLKFNKLANFTEEDRNNERYWNGVLPVLLKAYAQYYRDDFRTWEIVAVEKLLSASVEGINLVGAADLVTRNNSKAEMADNKTAKMKKQSDGSHLESWETRFQFKLYTFLWNEMFPEDKIGYFLANVISKPGIQMKVHETFPNFLARLAMDIRQRPTEYFKRERFPLTKDTMLHFRTRQLGPILARFKLLQTVQPNTLGWDALVMHRSESSCFSFGRRCPFFGHCHKGEALEKMKLVKRTIKHEHHAEKN